MSAIFASQDEATMPYRVGQAVTIQQVDVNGETGYVVTRPRFQTNKPNPVLVAFRALGGDAAVWHDAVFAVEIYGGLREWDDPRSYFHSLTVATDEQVGHAEQVLHRLAQMAEAGL